MTSMSFICFKRDNMPRVNDKTIMLFAFACNLAFAQTDKNKIAAFHLSFVSPLGTNGMHSAQTSNTASLNLLVGISKKEEAFTLGR